MTGPRSLVPVLCLALAGCSQPAPPAPQFDLVIANGRVIDPESGLDGVRHVGIRGGTIADVSDDAARRARASSMPPTTS